MTDAPQYDSPELSFSQKVKSFSDFILDPLFSSEIHQLLQRAGSTPNQFSTALLGHLKADESIATPYRVFVQNQARERAEPLSVEQCFGVFGPRNTQTFMISYRLARALEDAKLPLFHREIRSGHLELHPDRILRYAVECSQYFGEENPLHPKYYHLGLLFDLARISAQRIKGLAHRQSCEAFIDSRFQAALKVCGLVQEVAKTQRSIKNEKILFTLPLLMEAARCCMASFYKDYPEWSEYCDALELSEPVRSLAEQRRFQASFRLLAMTLCWSLPELHSLAKGVLLSDMPWISEKESPEFFVPMSIYWICWHLIHQPQLAESFGPSIQCREFRPEFSGLELEVPIEWVKHHLKTPTLKGPKEGL